MNIQRIILLMTALISNLAIWFGPQTHEFCILISTVFIAFNFCLDGWKNSFISPKFAISFLLFTPMLVPGAAYYLFDFKLYSYNNFAHQLDDTLTIEMLKLFLVTSQIYTFFVLNNEGKSFKPKLTFNQTRLPFLVIIVLYLLATYFTESGPTLITASYDELLAEKSSLMTLAGVLLTSMWSCMYVKYRDYILVGDRLKKMIFWLATFTCIIWFVLHAHRNELIGYVTVLILHQKLYSNKIPWKSIVLGLSFIFMLYLIGYIRTASLADGGIEDRINNSFNSTFVSHSSQTEYANMPSGIGNVTETFQTSMYHFTKGDHDFLAGKTFFTLPYTMIPSNLIQALGLPNSYDYLYNYIILEQYDYNGGNYIFSPAYGNFGWFGMVGGAMFFAFVARWTNNAWKSNNFYKVFGACAILLLGIKSVWYGPLPVMKTIFYSWILFKSIQLVFNTGTWIKGIKPITTSRIRTTT